ncbi:hypothetical protein GCM10010278_12720 [Streptomyces melanogenes]|nr:hypothetical protein GCM10010278_12720 [Streptomyces melanogenes]
MSRPPRPRLKSLPGPTGHPVAAQPASPQTAVGAPKGVAEGVLSALRPDPRSWDDGRRIVAMLHIVAPRGAIPTATSRCDCGRDRSAVGRARVLALIADHTDHRAQCPLRSMQEGRTAA